ncbi:Y+L amino acid transporter 2 [Folsomia candida]|uniref:Y+L amino acid transporter 2 n=1 Tax=Folsomia candida TaxID=158441 RepID=UPI000B8F9D6B|nr:Y+L amino acid transporter 2 [Folsomia candida]
MGKTKVESAKNGIGGDENHPKLGKDHNSINNSVEKPAPNLEGEKQKINLKREIGLLEAVGITIGCIIGSGIFISPKGITTHVHSVGASLVIWAVCGFLSMLGAFCFAELGTTWPCAGGTYTYIFEAFGPVPAFLSLWAQNLMFVPIGNAVTGLVFAKYIAQPFFPTGCEVPDSAVQLLAAAAICLLAFMNCCDIKFINKFINTFMFLKLTAVALVILGGGFAVFQRGTDNFTNMWEGSNITVESLLFSIYAGSFAFGGWSALSTMMEELKNPYKNLPRAIFISLTLVTLIYLLANASYFSVLSPAEMMQSDAVAVTFVHELVGSYFVGIVPVFVSLSTFGFLSLHIMTNSRNCFVGARHGHFPSVLSLITISYHTPAAAIIFQSLLSLVFLYTADVFSLINFGAFMQWFFQTLCIVGLIYLRITNPDLPRPYKISLVIPIIYLLLSLLFVVIPIYVSPVDSLISILITITGLPVYYLLIKRTSEKGGSKLSDNVTVLAQKAFMLVKED